MNIDTPADSPIDSPLRRVQRVRHALEARLCTVAAVTRLGPGIVSIRLQSDALRRFTSASFDDHVKLMLPPADGSTFVLPQPGPNGPQLPPGAVRPVMRDFTPRAFDTDAGTLDIEFALHGHGPASSWAAGARPGDVIGIGGPRGSLVIPTDFDWHLLIGDESALPAIARRLEELPATARAFVLLAIGDVADRRELASAARLELQWLPAGGLAAAAAALSLPAGEGYAWAGGEAAEIAEVRRVLVQQHGLPKERIRAAAYWKRGAQGHHENLEG